jgi:hypothetical protein
MLKRAMKRAITLIKGNVQVASQLAGEFKMSESTPNQFQLCFQPLYRSGSGYSFPCSPQGLVDLNQLSERARTNYLFARAMVGRDLAVPAVKPTALH